MIFHPRGIVNKSSFETLFHNPVTPSGSTSSTLVIFGILIAFVIVLGTFSMAEAHPHVTIDLMESHSHDVHDENFQENFIVHTFKDVIFSVFDFIKNILFG